MLYVLYGKDQFRAREELVKIRRELDKDGNLAHNTVRIEGTDVRTLTAADLRAAGHTASFFAEDRLVIVEGLLAKLSGARRRTSSSARRSRSNEDGVSGELDQYLDVLNNLPETTTVVLIDEVAPNKGFMDGIDGKARIKQFETLKGDQLRGWAAERVRAQGATFAAGALDRLISLIDGNHLGELASEIDKLITYANGRPVEMRDVDDMVSGAIAYQTWDLTDAVIEGRTDRALGVLRRMDARDHPRQMLSYMLVRQYRQLMLAQALLKEGMSTQQIGGHLGLTPGSFPLRKIVEQASRFPADRLEQAYKRLLENDVAVKTGVLEADTSLELLVVSLAELARGPRRTAAAGRR
jgi:DNA polymerase-3 subunit delta